MTELESRTVVNTFLKSACVALLLLLTSASGASAQTLKLPNSIFAAAATADWVSTYQFIQRGANETNPLINRMQTKPALMIASGAAIDVAGLWAWNRYVGEKHPRLAAVGLYAAAGFRIWLAARNNGLNRR